MFVRARFLVPGPVGSTVIGGVPGRRSVNPTCYTLQEFEMRRAGRLSGL